MKVFISSVRHLLKEERAALPPFLRLIDHEPLRFEDFTAQDRSSREACLAGVDAADVYVLLLASRYGTPFPDTNLSPTAEEFRRARQRGIPILVFNKSVDEDDEPEQVDFKSEVGHYISGRLWRAFTHPASCNQAVGEALKALDTERGPIDRKAPREPITVPWLSEIALPEPPIQASGFLGRRSTFVPSSVSAPLLELHVIGVGVTSAPSLRQMEERARQVARDMRNLGWVAEGDQLVVGAVGGFGWALRPPAMSSSGTFPGQLTIEQFRGALVHSAGICAFQSLDTDFLGAVVDQQSLQTDLASLLAIIATELPATESVTLAACLSRANRVSEGNPGLTGTRTGGRLATSGPVELRAGGDFVIPTRRLKSGFGDLGADLAHAVIAQLRERR